MLTVKFGRKYEVKGSKTHVIMYRMKLIWLHYLTESLKEPDKLIALNKECIRDGTGISPN